jgi:hypothetical protein
MSLIRPEDGVIGDVVRARTLRPWPSIVLSIRSYIFDHAGAFATTSSGSDLDDRLSPLGQVCLRHHLKSFWQHTLRA